MIPVFHAAGHIWHMHVPLDGMPYVQASRYHGSSTIPEALNRGLLHFLSDPINSRAARSQTRQSSRRYNHHHHHHHWAAVVSRHWAMTWACFLPVSLSCAVLCQIVSLQYLSRSSLHRLAGLPCHIFLSLMDCWGGWCALPGTISFFSHCWLYLTFVLSLTQMLVFLCLYVILSILIWSVRPQVCSVLVWSVSNAPGGTNHGRGNSWFPQHPRQTCRHPESPSSQCMHGHTYFLYTRSLDSIQYMHRITSENKKYDCSGRRDREGTGLLIVTGILLLDYDKGNPTEGCQSQ